MEKIKITVPEVLISKRLDLYLTERLDGRFSREEIKAAIEAKKVLVNSKPAKPSLRPVQGDVVEAELEEKKPFTLEAEKIALNIIFEDASIIAIDKPVGLVVHPGAGNSSGTLVNALLGQAKHLSDVGGSERPGIVHRLDKDTSGILLVAKTNIAHRKLQAQFAARSLTKIYTALVKGSVEFEEGHLDGAIGRDPKVREKMAVRHPDDKAGRQAQSRYRVIERYRYSTLLEVQIMTGRTHQIRVHMQHLGHPVVGDVLYGTPSGSRLMLHASKIIFTHPRTGKMVQLESPLPKEFKKVLELEKSRS